MSLFFWMSKLRGDMYLCFFFFFSSRRRHTRYWRDWSSDVCSSDLAVLIHVQREVNTLVLQLFIGGKVEDEIVKQLIRSLWHGRFGNDTFHCVDGRSIRQTVRLHRHRIRGLRLLVGTAYRRKANRE